MELINLKLVCCFFFSGIFQTVLSKKKINYKYFVTKYSSINLSTIKAAYMNKVLHNFFLQIKCQDKKRLNSRNTAY